MLRFKQFHGSGNELEQAVNGWLAELEPDVTYMVQTTDGAGKVTISFLFEESFRGQEIRFQSERGLSRTNMRPAPAESLPDKPIPVAEEPGHISSERP